MAGEKASERGRLSRSKGAPTAQPGTGKEKDKVAAKDVVPASAVARRGTR
jgi:hypothetical protein